MLEELKRIYGELSSEVADWIDDNLKYLSDSEKTNYLKILKDVTDKSDCTPDIDTLSKVLAKTTGKQPKVYYWAVCMECKKEYDYDLPICPHCFKKGLECRMKAIKTSNMKPNTAVVKYNKNYLGDGRERICYGCEHNELSFCKHFGDDTWTCHKNEYEACECKVCCATAKKENRIRSGSVDNAKFSYAKPLKVAGGSN